MSLRVHLADSFHLSAREVAPSGSEAAAALRATIEALKHGPKSSDLHELHPPVRHYYWRYIAGVALRVRFSFQPDRIVVLRVERVQTGFQATSPVARGR